MRDLRRQARWVVGLALGLLAGGCGGPTSSMTEATVSGSVTLMGKPVTTGQVGFSAANSARQDVAPRSAEIGKDGRYTIKALVGQNIVTPMIPSMRKQGGDMRRAVKNFEVTSGENKLDIDIPAFRPPPQP